MTRGQYIAMCAIGFVAVIAFLQGARIQQRLYGGASVQALAAFGRRGRLRPQGALLETGWG